MDSLSSNTPTVIPQLENDPVTRSSAPKKREVSFSQRYVRDYSVRPNIISLDHCYSRRWNSQSAQSHAQTAKYVSWTDNADQETQPTTCNVEDERLDVEGIVEEESQFDSKASMLMTECERHMRMARPHASIAADEPINKTGWTAAQNKIFNRVYKVLAGARLSKLANAGSVNEPIQRRNGADKSAKRLRQVFSNACWDEELLSWLHSVCMDNLHSTILADYLEALQTLRAKVPVLIEKMIAQSEHRERMSSISNEAMDLLLKRPWDPITAMPSRGKLERLPKNPLLIIVPQTPQLDSMIPVVKHRRSKLWNSQLSGMAKVIAVPAPNIDRLTGRWECFDAMVGSVRACLSEVKELYPNKPIILLGWNFGALLATYVGAMEKLAAVVALGYPLLGVNGLRGDADDIIVDSTTPTLFVVGEHAQTCPVADLENMRENMRVENSLLVVSGANDKLNINYKTKKERNLTQTIVDRCIQDEIRSYLERILTLPTPQLIHGATLTTTLERLKKRKPPTTISTFKGNNKIVTTIKGMGSLMPVFPRKRKSPLKDGKLRKQIKYAKILASEQELAQEQLAAISAITSTQNTSDPLNLSSSSQGSLTTLKPYSLSLPHLSSNSDNAQAPFYSESVAPFIKQEPIEARSNPQHSRIYPTHYPTHAVKRKELKVKPALPTYIQLGGHQTGQSFAISMEKARELMNLGILRSFDRIKPIGESSNINVETSRPVFSITPAAPVTFTSPSSNRMPLTASASGIMSNRSQHIRHLLSLDGRLVLPNNAKISVKPAAASRNTTSPVFADKGPLRPQSAPTLSPGQSLIKRQQFSVDQLPITSAISRQLQLTTAATDIPSTRTISVVVNTSKPTSDKTDVVATSTDESPNLTECRVPLQRSIVSTDPVKHSPVKVGGMFLRQLIKSSTETNPQQSTDCVTVPSIKAPVVSCKVSEALDADPTTTPGYVPDLSPTIDESKRLPEPPVDESHDEISTHAEATDTQEEIAISPPQKLKEFTPIKSRQLNLSDDSNPDIYDGDNDNNDSAISVDTKVVFPGASNPLSRDIPKEPCKTNTISIDVPLMNVVSPGASSTLSAQSNTGFHHIEADVLSRLVDDSPILLETTDSMFNPETE